MKLGMVGLRGSGKTTLFNAITGASAPVGLLAQGPDEVNIHHISVPDERLDELQRLLEVKRKVPAGIDIVDVPGVRVGAELHRGENERILAHIRTMDALMVVLRAFESPSYPHPLGGVDPERDLRELDSEIIIADLAVVEKRVEKLEKSLLHRTSTYEEEKRELELLKRLQKSLGEGRRLEEITLSEAEKKTLRGFQFLTAKKRLIVVNLEEGKSLDAGMFKKTEPVLGICAEIEMEIEELDESERADFFREMGIEEEALPRVIRAAYQTLGLVTFFTHNEREVRAWDITAGTPAIEAAGKVHSDMQRGFIRAEVIHFDDFKSCGSVREARTHGKYRLEGRDYIVQDGDIIQFRFSV